MNKLTALGLIETTSKTQTKNGTRCFHDPVTEVDYLSYASGYVRRAYSQEPSYTSETVRVIYQLNKTRKEVFVSPIYRNEYDCIVRIMIPNQEERLDRLAHCAAQFRNYKAKS